MGGKPSDDLGTPSPSGRLPQETQISNDPAVDEATPQEDQPCRARTPTMVEPKPLPPMNIVSMTMNYNLSTSHQTEEGDWINLSNNPPSYNEVARIIAGWATGTGRTEARVPQHTDPNYRTRMQEAYTSVCNDIAIIAEDPGEKDVRTRLVYLHNQAFPY